MLCHVCTLLQHMYTALCVQKTCAWCRLSMTTDRPAKFTFQLLQLSTPGVTNNVVLLHAKQQHVLVFPKQVHDSCLGGYCKYPAFYKQCSSWSKPMVLTDQHPELQQLVCLAGMSNTVSQVALVSLRACCQAMAKPSLQVPSQLLAGFQQGQVSTADSGNHTAQQPVSSGADAQAFPSQPACLLAPDKQLWAAVWSQHHKTQTLADHCSSSPAARSQLGQLLHHHNQARQGRALLQAQDMAEHSHTVCTVPWLLSTIPPESTAQSGLFPRPIADNSLCQLPCSSTAHL